MSVVATCSKSDKSVVATCSKTDKSVVATCSKTDKSVVATCSQGEVDLSRPHHPSLSPHIPLIGRRRRPLVRRPKAAVPPRLPAVVGAGNGAAPLLRLLGGIRRRRRPCRRDPGTGCVPVHSAAANIRKNKNTVKICTIFCTHRNILHENIKKNVNPT
jgi:hypothetical protein